MKLMDLKRRTLIRIGSYLAAIILVLGGATAVGINRAIDYRTKMEYTYLRALQDLGDYLDNISIALEKGIYAGTPAQLNGLSAKLFREAGAAKYSLSFLPANNLELKDTNKFLSQVGDYAINLSKRVTPEQKISEGDIQNLTTLSTFAKKLSKKVTEVVADANSGRIIIGDVKRSYEKENGISAGEAKSIEGGFKEMEDGFTGYPTLIYDGPFSDHLLQKEPLVTKDLDEISKDEARKRASLASSIDPAVLTDSGDEAGKMPSYVFSNNKITISITKQGGYLCYMLNGRDIAENKTTVQEAKVNARKYLDNMKIGSLIETYYEIAEGICTINYAYIVDEVTCYTDLIKVSVSMDNGQILSYDARGYLVNHRQRTIETPAISEEVARKNVSSILKVNDVRLTIIPSSGLNEAFCYQFTCSGTNNEEVLVYINAITGVEEQILILLVNENGTLVM